MSRPDHNPTRIVAFRAMDSNRIVAGLGPALSIEDEYIRADEVERMIAEAVAEALKTRRAA